MAGSKNPSSTTLRESPKMLRWIQDLDAHVTYDADGKAHLPDAVPGIDGVFLDLGQTSIDQFNNLPDSARHSSEQPETVVGPKATSAGCLPQCHQVYFWWGWRAHYDHCACQELQVDVAIDGGGVGAIAAMIGGFVPPAGIAIGVVAAYMAVMVTQISAYDTECSNANVDGIPGGVFPCMSWAAPGVFWIAKVC